jgi:hypothetical protein
MGLRGETPLWDAPKPPTALIIDWEGNSSPDFENELIDKAT